MFHLPSTARAIAADFLRGAIPGFFAGVVASAITIIIRKVCLP